MRVLIVEDEFLAAERLEKLVLEYDATCQLLPAVDSVTDAVHTLTHDHQIDLMFLDIQLADGNSFEVFRKVKVDIPVIFTTAFDNYALQAFKLNSIDYLLKPIQKEELFNAIKKYQKIRTGPFTNYAEIEKLRELIYSNSRKYKERLLIKYGNRLTYRSVSDIAYFHADGKMAYAVSYADNRKLAIDFTLEELENSLDPQKFFRINRKYIIHVDAILEIRGMSNRKVEVRVKCQGEHQLIVSRERVNNFKQWLNQ